MFLRIRLLFLTIATSSLLLFVLCLGSQNLNNRISLKLGVGKTAPLPSGFVVGISIVLGFIGGGFTSALISPRNKSLLEK